MIHQIVPAADGEGLVTDDMVVSYGEWEFPEDLHHDYMTEEDSLCSMFQQQSILIPSVCMC